MSIIRKELQENNIVCLFTVFGPRQHAFKNNDSKLIDLGQRGNNVFIVFLVFLIFFFFFH